jgi:hypothetical protein
VKYAQCMTIWPFDVVVLFSEECAVFEVLCSVSD